MKLCKSSLLALSLLTTCLAAQQPQQQYYAAPQQYYEQQQQYTQQPQQCYAQQQPQKCYVPPRQQVVAHPYYSSCRPPCYQPPYCTCCQRCNWRHYDYYTNPRIGYDQESLAERENDASWPSRQGDPLNEFLYR